MRFELTKQLIGEILFAMEDQDDTSRLDTYKGTIINSNDIFDNNEFDGEAADEKDNAPGIDDNDRYINLPEWDSADGFRLMESFTAGLRNPIVREELSSALDRGRGVFRAFKDTVSRYPEVEKRWFDYKDRGMTREVIRWYNALRELWGMELIGEEPEDTEDLACEDFRFRAGGAEDTGAAAELHRQCVDAAADSGGLSSWVFPGTICVVAESAGGEFAAYISAVSEVSSALHICALEVKPEYRGLGLGETLLARLLELSAGRDISCISIDLPADAENFSRVLAREKFQPGVTRYFRKEQPAAAPR